MRQTLYYQLPWADDPTTLAILLEAGQVVEAAFVDGEVAATPPEQHEVLRQLQHYFASPQSGFKLPLQARGTPFQQRVWQQLRQIPPGSVLSYGELARRLHTSPRAVGMACKANPIALIVPCHRVVGQHDLGGYAGQTRGPVWSRKQRLLQHEGAIA